MIMIGLSPCHIAIRLETGSQFDLNPEAFLCCHDLSYLIIRFIQYIFTGPCRQMAQETEERGILTGGEAQSCASH